MPIQVVEDTLVYLESELVVDTTGTPVTTKINTDWTKSCKKRGSATTVTLTITHDANGVYDITGTFAETGTYFASYSVVVDGITQRFTQTVQVITAAQADPAASITSGANAEAVAAVIMAEPVGGASGTIGAALARLVSGAVTTIPTGEALSADNTLTLEVNGSYLTADGDARDFLDTDWTVHSLTDVGVSVFFVALAGSLVLRQDMTVVNATTVRLELTGAQTYQMRNASAYKVWAELPSLADPVLLVGGPLAMQG